MLYKYIEQKNSKVTTFTKDKKNARLYGEKAVTELDIYTITVYEEIVC